jgi:hypothetical protein
MDKSTIYIALITLGIILTLILYITMTMYKSVYIIYTIFKIFFLVLFILWMNKYFTKHIKKMLYYDVDEPDNEKDFLQNLVKNFKIYG